VPLAGRLVETRPGPAATKASAIWIEPAVIARLAALSSADGSPKLEAQGPA
jgi:hypothetical protein